MSRRVIGLCCVLMLASLRCLGATLGEALEAPDLVWEAGGDAPWDVTTDVTSDGVDAAVSGGIADSEESWIQTTITGPAVVTFKWKASSEQEFDLLTVLVDDLPGSAISGLTDWLDGNVIVPEGVHTVRWVYTKDEGEFDGLDTAWLDEVRVLPMVDLGEAVDAPGITLGATGWFGVPDVSHDGVDSAQTSALAGNGKATLQTTLTGPGTLTFFWKVSSEENFDVLKITVDGTKIAAISGEVDWTQQSVQIPAGNHAVAWVYSKDAETSVGGDAGWTDQISFGGAIDLGSALDGSGILWTTGGDGAWTGEGLVTHDGIDAAESAAIGNAQQTWIEAAVTGPIQLSFWWKVSCETNFDFLNLTVDGALVERHSGEMDWTHQVISLPPGDHAVRWQFSKDASGSGGLDKAWLDQVTLVSSILPDDALDQPGLSWKSGGAAIWLGEASETHDGVDAARSGAILDGQESWIETTITGPTTLSFYWKASSETNYDTLAVVVDGAIKDFISGEVDWTLESIDMPAGAHTVRWRYLKDESGISGRDTVWVDQVAIGGQGRSPQIGSVQLGAAMLRIPVQNLTIDTAFVVEVSTDLKSWTAVSTNTATDSTMTLDRPTVSTYEFVRIRIGAAPVFAPATLSVLHVAVTSGDYAGTDYDVNFSGATSGTFTESGDFDASGTFTYAPSGNSATVRLDYSNPIGDFDSMALRFQSATNGSFSGTISASGSVRPFAGDFSSAGP